MTLQARPRVTERMETQSYAVTIRRVLVLQALRYMFHSRWLRRRFENTVSSGLVGCGAGNVLASRFPEEPGLSLQHAFSGYVSKRWTKCRPSQFIIKPGLTITYERQASSPIITHTRRRLSVFQHFSHSLMMCFFHKWFVRLRLKKFMTNHVWYAVMLHPWPTENIWLVIVPRPKHTHSHTHIESTLTETIFIDRLVLLHSSLFLWSFGSEGKGQRWEWWWRWHTFWQSAHEGTKKDDRTFR